MQDFGWKRALSIVLFIVGEFVPQVAPFKPAIDAIATALGITGIAHAGVKAVKKSAAKSKSDDDLLVQ